MSSPRFHCALCKVHFCAKPDREVAFPAGCPTKDHAEALARVRGAYADEATHRIYQAAARTEAGGYGEWPRVREVVEFARANDWKRIGLAFCIGLRAEAALAAGIFTHHGLEVYSACCSVGQLSKRELGLEDEDQITPGRYEGGCNPIGQAAVLAEHGTELNVIVGLCVGHDSLFIQASTAPVTVLVAKDRVTGHNPAAALYQAHGYHRKRVLD